MILSFIVVLVAHVAVADHVAVVAFQLPGADK